MINLWFFFLFLAAQTLQPDNLYSVMVQECDPVPFAGILFTPEAATKILVDHRAQLDQLAADLEYKHKVEMAEAQLKLDQAKILLDTEKEKNELLQKENDRVNEQNQKIQWWGVIIPVVAGSAVIMLLTATGIVLLMN